MFYTMCFMLHPDYAVVHLKQAMRKRRVAGYDSSAYLPVCQR
jgi:hypothetical protein